MSKSNFTRRGLLKTGAVTGAGLAMPTIFTSGAMAFTNEPTGDTVTFGFNVPQTGPYAEEGLDELRAQELAIQHINGEGDGGMLNTFSSKALDGTGILGKKAAFVTGAAGAAVGATLGGPVGAVIGGIVGSATGGTAASLEQEVVTYVQANPVQPVILEGEPVLRSQATLYRSRRAVREPEHQAVLSALYDRLGLEVRNRVTV